jgi:hypothetical protein
VLETWLATKLVSGWGVANHLSHGREPVALTNAAAVAVLSNSVREVRATKLGGIIAFKNVEVNTPFGKAA